MNNMIKKLTIAAVCLQLVGLPVFAEELGQDYFVEKTLKSNNLSIETSKPKPIQDELVNSTLTNKNYKIEIEKNTPITDNFVEKKLVEKDFQNVPNGKTEIKDVFAEKSLVQRSGEMNVTNNEYDIDPTRRIPVKLKVEQEYTTKTNLEEGQIIEFKVAEDVKVGNKIFIPKDTKVTGRVETVSMNETYGVPADLIVEKFIVKASNREDFLLEGASLKRVGANRAIWVYPLFYGGLMFFGAGVVFIPIRGGHAKLKIKDTYQVHYCPSL